ncbi:Formin-binding protein 1 [Phlyctochytrium planicorne]|nr:Formin-binding protein 1 [Phlyctochytrium planicorne]KAJ3109669.1 Formin-binding protein 1 [Phlyctochytrium planicorne]
MMNINEFMKRRAEIEAEYSKNLQRLVKPYKDELTKRMSDKKSGSYNKALLSSTLMQAWTQLLNQTENEGLVRNTVAEKIDTDLRKSVKVQAKELDKRQKEIKKGLAELQKQVSSMEKLREKFEAETKSMEASKISLDKAISNPKATEKEKESLRLEVDRKGATATDTNNLKNKLYRITIPNVLDEIQKDDENTRVTVSKIGFTTYYELLAAQQPGIVGCLDSMNSVFQLINAEYDSDLFIKLMKTGTELPADYVFDEKVAVKDFTAKRSHSRSKSEAKDDDDAILALPPKKGRRLAADRVKSLEKDLAEAERKRQGVETLISVYEQQATKDAKYLQDLQGQKNGFDVKIDNIGLKRHRLLVYIAEADKTAPPELPAHLVGKSIQSPVTSPNREFLSSPSKSNVLQDEQSSSPQSVGVERRISYSGVPGEAWGGDRPSVSGPPLICKARMLYDFEAAPGSQEMSAFAGEELDIVEQQDDGYLFKLVF